MQQSRLSLFVFVVGAVFWLTTSMTCSNKRTTEAVAVEGLIKKIKPNKIVIHGSANAVLDNDGLQSRFFFVRHAEKEKGKKDPGLLPEGKARAQRLVTIFEDLPLRRVYATNYQRTQLTAAPVASSMHLQVINYAPKGFHGIFTQLLEQSPLGHYLFVGHSNTLALMLNHLTGKEVYKNIPESEYDRFYVASVYEDKRVVVLELKY